MSEDRSPSLRRAFGLTGLAAYGVGGMLGGGIYALVGEVAGEAGSFAWLAFVVAMLAAAPTALCYAELVTRFPRSGGESIFVRRAFGSDWAALLTGWTVIFSGIVSMGTLAHAFVGYLGPLLGPARTPPDWIVVLLFLLGLAAINAWGIRFTSRANLLATSIELTGLLLVIVAGLAVVAGWTGPLQTMATESTNAVGRSAFPLAILHASTLAFYAYIGFEDMVNVAEEVREPRRIYPVALPLALLVVGTVYAAVTSLATAAVPVDELASSSSPLQEVVRRGATWLPTPVFAVIALFAVANTALLNFVMASRLAYGLADEGLLPRWLARVHAGRRTPLRSIVTILALAVALTLTGTLQSLAGTTSLLILLVFLIVDGALLWIRSGRGRAAESSDPADREAIFRVPIALPIAGMLFAAALVPFAPTRSVLTALGVVAAGGLLVIVRAVWAGYPEDSGRSNR